MKNLSRRKKAAAKKAELISNRTLIDLKKVSRALGKVARDPDVGKGVEVKVFSHGLVMRFGNEGTKKRVARSLTEGKIPTEGSGAVAYLNAVGQLYFADKVDIQKAVTTARRDISEKEKAFYSRFAPSAK